MKKPSVSPFIAALDAAEPVFSGVQDNQLELPTPCADWNVRELLNHTYNELAWVPELLAGKTIEQVGDALDGDLVGEDPRRSWHAYADTARQSAGQTPDEAVTHLSYGNLPASEYLNDMAIEVVIHGWDLAKALGAEFHIPEDLAKTLRKVHFHKVTAWREKGLIGPEVSVPASASAEAKLLGMFGRKP